MTIGPILPGLKKIGHKGLNLIFNFNNIFIIHVKVMVIFFILLQDHNQISWKLSIYSC